MTRENSRNTPPDCGGGVFAPSDAEAQPPGRKSRRRKSPCKRRPARPKRCRPNVKTPAAVLGRCAENLVIWYLRQRNWRILARNYADDCGEIDIIAAKKGADLPDAETIAFVEVKARSSLRAISPQFNVTCAKQKKISASVKSYIARNPRRKAIYRCDIAAITMIRNHAPQIVYIPNAFCVRDEFCRQ